MHTRWYTFLVLFYTRTGALHRECRGCHRELDDGHVRRRPRDQGGAPLGKSHHGPVAVAVARPWCTSAETSRQSYILRARPGRRVGQVRDAKHAVPGTARVFV